MAIKAGKLRPSQAATQFGPGALVDLPTLSMIISGTDAWELGHARRIDEPRLARQLEVDGFRAPPWYENRTKVGGVPARLFPEFLVCPRCNRLARYPGFDGKQGQTFRFEERWKRFLCRAADCRGKGNAVVYPARFIVACPKGHLEDFPWHVYLHGPDVDCGADLKLEDSGRTGAITDLWVKCTVHGDAKKNLGQAFGRQGRQRLPKCRGNRPWLGDVEPGGCDEHLHVLLRGASNAYFPFVQSAISIPPWSDPLQIALGANWEALAKVDSLADVEGFRRFANAPLLDPYSDEEIWEAIRRRREGAASADVDLRAEEWRAFQAERGAADAKAQFRAVVAPVPEAMTSWLSRMVKLERLREVRALRAFTRIDPIPDIGTMEDITPIEPRLAPISKKRQGWLPAVELRGEGVFLQFDEDRLSRWEDSARVKQLWARYERHQGGWAHARELDGMMTRPPRFLLLHGLSHLLIRGLALECGYAEASLRERIYSRTGSGAMAGILIYTATPDSEGSLGGLIDATRPDFFGPLFERALRGAELCANDPLCADRPLERGDDLNGAACHACLLISETSCEASNHFLDRNLIVSTLANLGVDFASS